MPIEIPDGAPLPVVVAAIAASLVWYWLKNRPPAPPSPAPSGAEGGGWLSSLVGNRAAILAALAAAWANRQELIDLAAKVAELVRKATGRKPADPPEGDGK